jgi:hypothetical protein
MTKELVVTIGLYLALLLSISTNMYLFRRVEVMYVTQGTLVEIVQQQGLEIEVRKAACNAD